MQYDAFSWKRYKGKEFSEFNYCEKYNEKNKESYKYEFKII